MFKKIKNFFKWVILREVSTEKLISLGLKVGKNFSRGNNVQIDTSFPWLISIGDNVTMSSNVVILAHDASTYMFLYYAKIGLVQIGNNVFIGNDSTILCNVKVGNNVIIGAKSNVTKDIPDDSLVAGNPARVIGSVSEYLEKNKCLAKERPFYNIKARQNIPDLQKEKMILELQNGIGFTK
ncbi:MAG: hypothetical protein K0Q75_29 [Anaerospora sp.]|jgi:maltose O-acetyltransferase|nr:hypothetical protein [Anaerospora sp.]